MNNLGCLLMELGPKAPRKFAESGRLLKRCLALRREHVGDDHPLAISTALNLGQWHVANGEEAVGRPLLTKTYERAIRVLGPAHHTTLNCGRSLAIAAFGEGDMERAEYFTRQGYRAALEAHGMVDPLTISNAGLLVNALIAGGKLEQAKELAPRCYNASVELYGEDHVQTTRAATLFVDLYEALGDKALEDKWRRRLRGTPFDPAAQSTAPPEKSED